MKFDNNTYLKMVAVPIFPQIHWRKQLLLFNVSPYNLVFVYNKYLLGILCGVFRNNGNKFIS